MFSQFSAVLRTYVHRKIALNLQFRAILIMAGAAGIEPANGGIKSRCLTTWLRPISVMVAQNIRPNIGYCKAHNALFFRSCKLLGKAVDITFKRACTNPPAGMIMGQLQRRRSGFSGIGE